MRRDPLQMLVNLVATEENPHQLVLRIASDLVLLKEAQRLCRKRPDAAATADGRIAEFCRSCKILPEYFQERLQLIAGILNLIPYEQDYYEILEVSPSASREAIKQAFRRLSFASHPDTNPGDPNAPERFRKIQQAYEVLSNDMLRQSYARNLETRSWSEEDVRKVDVAGPPWWWKWRNAWPAGALLLLLVLLIFVVDYQRWQTERYYTRVQVLPAPKDAPSSSPPPSLGVGPAQEADQEAVPPSPAAPSAEAEAPPPPPPQPSATTRETTGPLKAVPIPNVAAKPEEPSPKTGAAKSGVEKPAAAPAATSQHTLNSRQSPQKPPAPSAPVAALSPSGKPGMNQPHSDAKPVEPMPSSSSKRQTTASAKSGDGPAPEHMVKLQDVDREIKTFLSRYTSTYESKNPAALMSLFEADAIENGGPVQNLVPVYQANFQRAEKLRYRIDVGRWEVRENEVKVDGSFSLSVQFWHEAPVESRGSIQMTLVRRGSEFRVKRLDYSFR